jgi:hypothetical protein
MSTETPRRLTTALALALALAIAACGSDEPAGTTTSDAPGGVLAGQWERAESSFTSLDGMVIEVNADGTEAVILTVPDNEFQFQAGDVKWRSIEPTGDGEFSFEDLVREEGSGATSYVEGVITVTGDDTLEMTFPTTGTVQEWVRVSE